MTTPRAGKYCPRCQTMTFLDREVCENCGHHFRMGAAAPAGGEDGSLHRTMQFTLPPLARREPLEAIPPGAPAPRRNRWPLAALAAVVLAAFALTVLWQKHAPSTAQSSPSPVGSWESALTSRSSSNARLTFVFARDGSGTFSWQEQGMGAAGRTRGQSPMKWHQDAQGLLVLAIAPSAAGDAVSGTLIAIFNSRPWLWRADPARKRLILGNLVFTEQLEQPAPPLAAPAAPAANRG